MSEATQSMDLLAALRRRPDAQAAVRGSEKYPKLSGVVRFYQTRRGVLVFTEESFFACDRQKSFLLWRKTPII